MSPADRCEEDAPTVVRSEEEKRSVEKTLRPLPLHVPKVVIELELERVGRGTCEAEAREQLGPFVDLHGPRGILHLC